MSHQLRQRDPRIELPRLVNSARGMPCTMRSPFCRGDFSTVVWCHSNASQHGKGLWKKAHDIFGFYGCQECHHWYDLASRELGVSAADRDAAYRRAHDESMVLALRAGALR